MHHRAKIDAPSGTAFLLGEAAAAGRGIDARRPLGAGPRRPHRRAAVRRYRLCLVARRHRRRRSHRDLRRPYERIELSHQAEDRMIFAQGALKAALWAHGKKPGFYSMADVLGLKISEHDVEHGTGFANGSCCGKRNRNGIANNERSSSRAGASRPERMESEESLHRLEGSRSHRAGRRRGQGSRPQAEGAGAVVRYRLYLGAASARSTRSI